MKHHPSAPKKILVVGKYYHPFMGGIETNTQSVAEELSKGSLVEVLCFSDGAPTKSETVNNVRVVRSKPFAKITNQPISIDYFIRVLTTKADAIHFHAPNMVAGAALSLRIVFDRKTKLITTHHMDVFGRPILKQINKFLYKFIISRSRYTIVTSMKNAQVSSDLPKSENIFAIPLGIRPENYSISPAVLADAADLRQRLAGSAPTVGFLGRHARYKGLMELVQAIAIRQDVHALIGGEGEYTEQAKELAKQLKVEDRVHFLGKLSHREKIVLLKAIDIFAFPSTEITEAFGISQLEAMICGAPVVSADIPTGVTDVSVDGVTALLSRPKDPQSLSQCFDRILADGNLRRELTEEAKRRVLEIYSEDLTAKRTAELITSSID